MFFLRYKVVNLGLVRTETKSGVFVDFENFVERRVTQRKVDFATFITRVGGVIGVGKNLLWVVILSFTSLVSILGFVNKYWKIK